VTPQQVKNQFRERGESVASWADAHGYPRDVVYRVLNGRTPAWRGLPHQVAVALGLKPNPNKTSV
jgi:gp16 family phage-associated protein